jgi:hypothetical protein
MARRWRREVESRGIRHEHGLDAFSICRSAYVTFSVRGAKAVAQHLMPYTGNRPLFVLLHYCITVFIARYTGIRSLHVRLLSIRI